MALPASFLDELRARTPLSAVIGRRVRLARSGRQWKGCCPFHGEKTPSFYVYEDGHFHCFGCGAHGDAIGFVMQSEGAGFMEAVERLAAEAGLEVPKASPAAAEAERKRHDLGAVLDLAQASYHRRLFLPEGRRAKEYLLGRGLSEQTIARFGLGWSGEGRGSVATELARQGVTQDQLVDAGLMRRDDETGRVFELFFNRVMFPIRDRRGRVISFGGRILGDGQPKYVNGPETALFAKRRTLYALDLAREAVRSSARLVVVEGYMDVIALHEHGFPGAVAPLGTALTEEQLEELWRLAPAPVLCFDGDAAGARATERAIATALPFVGVERTINTISLPAKEDPDSFIRKFGHHRFLEHLKNARGLIGSTYAFARRNALVGTPEQRANLKTKLENLLQPIPDKELKWQYLRSIRAELQREFRHIADRPDRLGLAAAADLSLVANERNAERSRILTAILLRHPSLLADVEPAYAALDLPEPLDRLREALCGWANAADVLDSSALTDHLTNSGLQAEAERVVAAEPFPLPGCALPTAMPAEAEEGWYHYYGLMRRNLLDHDVEDALLRYRSDQTEHNHRVLRNLSIVRERSNRAQFEADDEA